MNWEEFQEFIIRNNIKPIIYHYTPFDENVFEHAKCGRYRHRCGVLFNEKILLFVYMHSWESLRKIVMFLGVKNITVIDVEPGTRLTMIRDMETMNDSFETLSKNCVTLDYSDYHYILYS